MLIPAHLGTLKPHFSLLVMMAITAIILVGCGNSKKASAAKAGVKKEEKLGRWDPTIQVQYEKVDPKLAKEKGCRSCHMIRALLMRIKRLLPLSAHQRRMAQYISPGRAFLSHIRG
jgi:hypothetical protein